MPRTANTAGPKQRPLRSRDAWRGKRITEKAAVSRCRWCPAELPTPERHDCEGTRLAEARIKSLVAGTD